MLITRDYVLDVWSIACSQINVHNSYYNIKINATVSYLH